MKQEISCGIILFKYVEGKRKILLVKHVNGGHFGFPKGHIEAQETYKETALREVKEETNIDAYIIGNYYQKVGYKPKAGTYKNVYYFLGKPISEDLVKQEIEITQTLWVSEDNIFNYLKFDNDKMILIKAIKKINYIERDIDRSLMAYIENHVLPIYNKLDKAHGLDHVYHVIYEALKISKAFENINASMIYTIAAFHDIGLLDGRERHHITGGMRLLEDGFIKSKFTKEEIDIMVDAIYDHRASVGHEPRTIYGKIIAEADRDMNAYKIIKRTALYESSKHPDLPIEMQIKNCYDHMIEKYSETGYMKLYLNVGQSARELKKLRKMISNKKQMILKFEKLLTEI